MTSFSVRARFQSRNLASELVPSKALADDLGHGEAESAAVMQLLAIVIAG